MYLRHAAQGIGVLHPGTIGMGSDDFRIFQELVKGLRHVEIARIRAKLMELCRKRRDGP
jgi:hypothetical protein